MESRTLPKILRHVVVAYCLSASIVILPGCLTSDIAVFSQSDADEIFGGAGIWQPLEADNPKPFFARRVEDGSYLVGDSPGSLAADSDKKVRYLAVHLRDDFYVLQTPSGNGFELLLVQLTPKYLIGYVPGQLTSEAAAQVIGMTLSGHSGVPPGADRSKIKKYFIALTEMAGKIDDHVIFQRKGGFVESDGSQHDIGVANDAYANGDYKAALPIYRYLAERGNADAQLLVAKILAGPMYHPAMALQFARQSYASGKHEAAFLVAQLYRAGSSDTLTPSGLPSNPDYLEALQWAATAVVENVSEQEASAAMLSWSREACERPALKAENLNSKECRDSLSKLVLEKATVHHQKVAVSEAWVASVIKIESLKSERSEIQRKIKTNQGVQSELETKLKAQQARRSELLREARLRCQVLSKNDPDRLSSICVEALR